MAEIVAVVLKRGGPVDLDEMSELLGELRGWSREEAARHLLMGAGIVIRDATKSELEKIGAFLKKRRIPYLLLPTRDLPHLAPVAVQDLDVSESRITGRGGEVTVGREDFLVAVGGWLGEARFVVAVVARDGRTLLCDYSVHRDGAKIVEVAEKLLSHYAANRVSYGLHRVAREGVAAAAADAVTFPDETSFRAYVMWLATLAVCVEKAVSGKRKPYVSRLGRVRFRWGERLLDWEGQRRLEEAAVRALARPVVASRPTALSSRREAAKRLTLRIGVDVAMLLEQAALVRVAVVSAVVAALMWLVLVIVKCCR